MSTTNGNGKALRFGALVRVSTERQERQGESLRTQEGQIEAAVAALGGKITRRYYGQEHATADWEREKRDQLLADAERDSKPFDAVIVAHEDRWSRDDTRSGADLERLRKAGVRFFVLTREHDLWDPTALMYLGMSAVVGAYHARNQGKKAIENKIARIEKGIPAWGGLPFGRTFDPSKPEGQQWGIDEAKRDLVHDVAARLLAGESMERLAAEYGKQPSYLSRVLRLKCGDKVAVKFDVPDLRVKREFTVAVPPLLDEATIRAVRLKLAANRTYDHKPPVSVHNYLLRGRIFCSACGTCLTGQPKPQKDGTVFLYYRHHRKTERTKRCPFRPRPNIPAKAIEQAVLADLFDLFGNPAAIERAVKAAVPDCEKLMERCERLDAELAKIQKARVRVLDLIERDLLTDAQAEEKLRDLKDRGATLVAERDQVGATLAELPDAQAFSCFVERWESTDGTPPGIIVFDQDYKQQIGGNDLATWLDMTEPGNGKDRRHLVESAFSGRTPDGKPAGVYITPADGTTYYGRKQFKYQLRGRLIEGVARCLRS